MKKILLTICTIVFTITTLSAQRDSLANKPMIKLEKTTYDYGTIAKGGIGVAQISFTNEGIEPLVVNSVQRTSGNMSTDWIKEPIGKGKKGWIKITFNALPSVPVGPFTKTVFVNSNSKTPSVAIVFKGTVLPAKP